MKIFQRVQKQYAILGILSSQNRSPEKLSLNKRVLAGFLLFGCTAILQMVYALHVANGFLECMQRTCEAFGTVTVFNCFTAIVLRRTTISQSIDNIEKLINTRCKNPESKALFLKTSQRTERLNKIIFMVLVKIAVQLFILPKFIISFGTYFITDLGRDSFDVPIPMWFPFDTNNPIAYLIVSILDYIIIGYEYFVIACILSFAIGGFWFAISAINDIQCILRSINNKAQSSKNHSNKMMATFSEFIDVNVAAKEVEQSFSDILQPMFMALFTWSLIAISCSMLIFEVEILHQINLLHALFNATLNGVLGLALVFIACELGQRMSDAFAEIDLIIDQFNWYLFPIEIQRMLPMIIANAQESVALECFGSIACTREVFRKVLHCAYSYFSVLSQLAN